MKEKKQKKKQATQISQNEQIRAASRGRKRKKRKRDALVALAVIVVVFIAAVVVGSFTLFYIDGVSVSGNDGIYDDEQIISAAGLAKVENMLSFRAADAAEMLERNLPYITQAKITRELPGDIVIHVSYADPVFSVDCGQVWLLLNETGKVLSTAQSQPIGVAQLIGAQVQEYTVGSVAEFADENAFLAAARLYEACNQNRVDGLTSVEVKSAGSVEFSVANRFFIRGGTVSLMTEKMPIIRTIIEERSAKAGSYSLNLAADGSITVGNYHTQEAVSEEESTLADPNEIPTENTVEQQPGQSFESGDSVG